MLKNLFFLAFLTQKLAPSNVLNGIIFTIDKQCYLIFETTLFTDCKPYIIFFIQWGPLSFLLCLSHFRSLFHHFSAFSLPLLDVSASLFDKTQARASSLHIHWFLFLFFLFTQRSLSTLSFSFLSHFFLLSSLSVLR